MCELTGGYTKQGCTNGGGIDALVVVNHENINELTLDSDKLNVETLTLNDGKRAYKITPDLDSASATQTPTRSRENNSYMVAQTIMTILKDDEEATQKMTNELGKGFYLVGVMQSNGKNRLFGVKNGLVLDTEENVTGQLYDDLNGSTINFTGKEKDKAPLVSTALLDAILIPAS